MLSQERVQLMTKMAAYEENEGRKYMSIGNYFRSDYIGLQTIKSIICATIAYAILFAMYICYDFEVFMQDIYKMDLLAFVHSYRYFMAKKSLKRYYHHLKQLNAMYDLENRK